jgi:hypothetical protein
MTLGHDVIADREAETMKWWDEIEIRRGEAEAGLERQGRRWTDAEVQIKRGMVGRSAGWNSIGVAFQRRPAAVQVRAGRFASAPRRATPSSDDEGEDE